MKKLLLLLLLLAAPLARAYEFNLLFTPLPGAQGLHVAGYEFVGSTVVGDCSYFTSIDTGGKGGHTVITDYYSTCTWDFYGTQLSKAAGRMAEPTPISQVGTETIYAESGSSTTGQDTGGFGFVNTPSAHRTWVTANGTHAVVPDTTQTITATLISDGDYPLTLAGMNVYVGVTGTYNTAGGAATVTYACPASIPVGDTCTATITYSPQAISCTNSPYGYAYTDLAVRLVTNTNRGLPFTKGFTVTGVPYCGN